MPSIHVAWAALIGWAVWVVSPSKWRWVGPAHFAITFVVVAVTGNHFWLDGIVAMAILVPAYWFGVQIARRLSPSHPIDHQQSSRLAPLESAV